MATQDTGTPTPAKVEQLATQEVPLPPTALIGVFGTPANPKALVRLPRGKTQTVGIGDRLAGGTVRAIGEDKLVLLRMGKQQVMQMPRG